MDNQITPDENKKPQEPSPSVPAINNTNNLRQPVLQEGTPNIDQATTVHVGLPSEPNRRKNRILNKIISAIFIVGGIFLGFVFGSVINFGSCWKSECSPVEDLAPLYLPLASLLVTIPITRKLRDK